MDWTKAQREECVRLHREEFYEAKAISSLTEIPVEQIRFWLASATWAPKRRKVSTDYRAARHQDWEGYYANTLRSYFLRLAKKYPTAANPPTRPYLEAWLRGLGGACTCPYCQNPLTPKTFAVDHRQPVSRGGSSALDNLIPCCKRCNETKGELSEAEFTALHALAATWEEPARRILFRRLRGSFIIPRGSAKSDVPPPTV